MSLRTFRNVFVQVIDASCLQFLMKMDFLAVWKSVAKWVFNPIKAGICCGSTLALCGINTKKHKHAGKLRTPFRLWRLLAAPMRAQPHGHTNSHGWSHVGGGRLVSCLMRIFPTLWALKAADSFLRCVCLCAGWAVLWDYSTLMIHKKLLFQPTKSESSCWERIPIIEAKPRPSTKLIWIVNWCLIFSLSRWKLC